MVDVRLTATLDCLAAQRNQALDAVADNAAEIAFLRAKVAALEAELSDLVHLRERLEMRGRVGQPG